MAGYDGYGMPSVDFGWLGKLPEVRRRAEQQQSLTELADSLAAGSVDWKQAAGAAARSGNPGLAMQLLQRGSALEQFQGLNQLLGERTGGAPLDNPPPPPSTARPPRGGMPPVENDPNNSLPSGFSPRTSYNQNEKFVSVIPQGEGPNSGVDIAPGIAADVAAKFSDRFAASGPGAYPTRPSPLPPAPAPSAPVQPRGLSPRSLEIVRRMGHPDADPSTRNALMFLYQQENPEHKVMTTPDGTIVSIDPRTNQVTPIYKTEEKPTFGDLGTDPNTGEAVKGFIDPRARKVEPYTLPGSGTPNNPYAMPGKTNEAQTKDAGYASRALEAEQAFRDSKVISAATDITQHARAKIPVAGNYMVSPEFQVYDQASRNFINAILRRESGAAINQSEFDNAYAQYLPKPGDAPAKLEWKRQNRETVIKSLAAGAGRSYTPPYLFGPNGSIIPNPKAGQSASAPISNPQPGTSRADQKPNVAAPQPPVEGAKRAQDGHWYVQRNGQYFRVDQ